MKNNVKTDRQTENLHSILSLFYIKVVPLHPLFGKSEASDDANSRSD
jgi:hypothetical protein